MTEAVPKYRYNDPAVFRVYDQTRRLARYANACAVYKGMVATLGLEGSWLEVGAGEGELASLLNEALRSQLVITEINPVFLARIKKAFPGNLCEVADVTNLADFDDASFHGVVGFSMLDTLSLDELTLALAEMARVSMGPIIHFLDLQPDPNILSAEYPQHYLIPVTREKYGKPSFSLYRALEKYYMSQFCDVLPVMVMETKPGDHLGDFYPVSRELLTGETRAHSPLFDTDLVLKLFQAGGPTHLLHLLNGFSAVKDWYIRELCQTLAYWAPQTVCSLDAFEQRIRQAARAANLTAAFTMVEGKALIPAQEYPVMLHELGEFFVGKEVEKLYPAPAPGQTLLVSKLHMIKLEHKLAA